MSDTTLLDEALALALQLSAKDRMRLIEQVASSVEHEIETLPEQEQSQEHWGKSLNQLLDEIGPIEFLYPEIEDPVAWVKHLRAEQRRRRLGDWGEEE